MLSRSRFLLSSSDIQSCKPLSRHALLVWSVVLTIQLSIMEITLFCRGRHISASWWRRWWVDKFALWTCTHDLRLHEFQHSCVLVYTGVESNTWSNGCLSLFSVTFVLVLAYSSASTNCRFPHVFCFITPHFCTFCELGDCSADNDIFERDVSDMPYRHILLEKLRICANLINESL